jgi:hypothetical protein
MQMKSPRDVLLRHHQAAASKLDQIRTGIVTEIARKPTSKMGSWMEWLWPCPRAWAGLGATWLVIFGMHLAAGKHPFQAAMATQALSHQELLELRKQQQMLAKLIFPVETVAPQPPKRVPPPRSERRRNMTNV